MKQTNLNMLFQQLIINFAHLITVKPQTKAEFLENYSSDHLPLVVTVPLKR